MVFMAVSCRRMADQRWQITVEMGWGQILGKYFSMNSFTSAISCKRTKCVLKIIQYSNSRVEFIIYITMLPIIFLDCYSLWLYVSQKNVENERFFSLNLKNDILTKYLRTGAVREPCIRFEGNHLRVNYRLDFFWRHVSETQWDHYVYFTVTLQDGEVLVATECLQNRYMFPTSWLSQSAMKNYVNTSVSQNLQREKIQLFHNKTASVPMGKSCEEVASSWGPQHQLTDADRSRQYTMTRPHPEKNKFSRKMGQVVNVVQLQ